MSSTSPALLPLTIAVGFGIRYAVRSGSNAFRARGGRGGHDSAPKPVDISSDYGDAELGELRAAATRGDWPAMTAILQPIRLRGDFQRLSWLIGCIDDVKSDRLLTLGTQHPDDALARTIAGARYLGFAWEARTGQRASQVSEEQFKQFHQRLREAEEHLYAAVELDPVSAAPWYSLMVASRGLEHGHDITRRRFEAGTARDPFHVGMHRQMFQQQCQKWGGSHDEMHTFAREAMLKAPVGSEMGALVADAHLEHWLDLPRGEDVAYMRQPHVLQALREAAAQSIDHPAFAPPTTPYSALNAFAMAFWLAEDKRAAADLFQRIGDNATKSPWHYLGNPGQAYAAARHDSKKRK